MRLPYRDFEWVDREEINKVFKYLTSKFDLLDNSSDWDTIFKKCECSKKSHEKCSQGTGYFLEVDLEYPENLHKLHKYKQTF